jgi:hypothetical protein
LQRVADRHVVAHDGLARGDVGERHLVPFRHARFQGQAIREGRAFRQAAGVDDDRDVVVLVHADRTGSIHQRLHDCAIILACFVKSRKPEPK